VIGGGLTTVLFLGAPVVGGRDGQTEPSRVWYDRGPSPDARVWTSALRGYSHRRAVPRVVARGTSAGRTDPRPGTGPRPLPKGICHLNARGRICFGGSGTGHVVCAGIFVGLGRRVRARSSGCGQDWRASMRRPADGRTGHGWLVRGADQRGPPHQLHAPMTCDPAINVLTNGLRAITRAARHVPRRKEESLAAPQTLAMLPVAGRADVGATVRDHP